MGVPAIDVIIVSLFMQDNESVPEQTSRVTAVRSYTWQRAVIAIVITALIAGTGGYLLGTRANQNASQSTQRVSLNNSQNTSMQPTSYEPSKPAIEGERWVLKRKSGQGSTDILTFSSGRSSYYSPSIVRWRDLLLYVSEGGLYSHDVNSGETKLLFTIQQAGDSFANDGKIFFSEIIQGTLFFYVHMPGDNFSGVGHTYAFSLPPKENPKIVIDFPGAVKKIKGRYWVVRRDGSDVCGSRVTYALLDMVTKKGTLIAITNDGCQEGDRMVDVDRDNRMIVAGNTGSDNTPLEYGGHFGNYTDIKAIPLANPSLTVVPGF
jgi:hypothetical protein